MTINSCDIFSYQCKKEDKIYVLLSFFQKTSKEIKRYIQLEKKIFIFEKQNYVNIPYSLSLYLSQYPKLNIFTKEKTLSERISKSLTIECSRMRLTNRTDNIGVYSLLSFVNHKNKEDYKPNNNSLYVAISTYSFSKKEHLYTIQAFNTLTDMFNGRNQVLSNQNIVFSNKGELHSTLKNYCVNEINKLSGYQNIFFNLHFADQSINKDFINTFKSKLNIKSIQISNKDFENIKISKEDRENIQNQINKYKEQFICNQKHHVLYTDGSSISHKGEKYISGAYLLHTEHGYLNGTRVLNFHKDENISSNESEFLALYLGLNKLIEANLSHKTLSIVLDSDKVAEFLTSFKSSNKSDSIFDNIILFKIKKLLSKINYDYQIITIKSHAGNSNKHIKKCNDCVDRLAYNSILSHLDEKNISYKMKKRA